MNRREEFDSMSSEQKSKYCDWCWYNRQFRCAECLIHNARLSNQQQEEKSEDYRQQFGDDDRMTLEKVRRLSQQEENK
jgi:hypothetical protein